MTNFNPEQFMASPSVELFDSLRKEELVSLGEHLGLVVNKSMKKLVIQNALVKHLISVEVFDNAMMSRYALDSEMQYNLKKLELEDKEKEREREDKVRLRELELRELEIERQFNLEKLKIESNLELGRLDIEYKVGLQSSRNSF